MTLDVSNYYFIRASSGVSVMCRRGTDAPRIVSGGARYDVIARPRRTSIVQWNGDDPFKMDVSILLDGWSDHTLIEKDVANIEQMRHSQSDLTPPVTLYIDGAVPVKGAQWVLENLDWGDTVIWTPAGRLRQDGVLHLLQFVTAGSLHFNKVQTSTKPYIWKSGDTLLTVAVDHNTTTTVLKQLNGFRDSSAIKVGQTIKVP